MSVSLSQTVTDVTYDAVNFTLTLKKKTGNVIVSLKSATPPVPAGTIIMYTGTSAPTGGWSLCDGSNGTPDLRNKFVYGWGDQSIGSTGGATSNVTSADGAHSHSVGVNGTSLTVDQMPYHTHTPQGWYAGWPDDGTNTGGSYGYLTNWPGFASRRLQTSGAGGYDAHSHTASSDTASSHNHNMTTLPPYRRLSYIMKL